MIALAILGIIMAIAIPAYNDQVQRSRRADAQARLNETTQCMERFNTTNSTYVGGNAVCQPPNNAFYTFTVNIPNRNAFVASASPVGSQSTDACGQMGINQAGQKTHSSGSGCWN